MQQRNQGMCKACSVSRRCMAGEAKAREKAAKAEEREAQREAQRAAAEEAKRYPMEDLALLAELRAKAAAAGAFNEPIFVCAGSLATASEPWSSLMHKQGPAVYVWP